MAKALKKSVMAAASSFEPVIRRKTVPHEFVLDAMTTLAPRTRPMFGCVAIYVGDKIVFLLRDKPSGAADNGVWIATSKEHHESLHREFPNMRSIGLLGKEVTGWQVLPVNAPHFEKSAIRACEFVIERDPRIGKVPKGKQRSTAKGKGSIRPAGR